MIFAVSAKQYFSFIKMVCLCSHKKHYVVDDDNDDDGDGDEEEENMASCCAISFPPRLLPAPTFYLLAFIGFNGYYL